MLPGGGFDRVDPVETLEPIRNCEPLLGRIAGWMKPSAALFARIFAHRDYACPFEVRDASDWMARGHPASPCIDLRRGRRAALGDLPAALLHVLRRTMGLPERIGVTGVTLAVQEDGLRGTLQQAASHPPAPA